MACKLYFITATQKNKIKSEENVQTINFQGFPLFETISGIQMSV